MEYISLESGNRYAYVILPAVLTAIFLIYRWTAQPKLNLPPGPMGLPFVGYLPFLGKEPYKTLDKLKNKYGNVYSMYLGQNYVVILSDYPAVGEAYNQMAVSDRPPMLFDFVPDSLGFASLNGSAWIEQRRFTVKVMRDLGLGKSAWANVVEDEVADFLKLLESKKGEPIDIYVCLTPSISNSISSFLFGKRLPPGPDRDTLNATLDAFARFISHTSLWNYYPKLSVLLNKLQVRWYYDTFKKLAAFNKFMRNEVERHKKSDNEDDFISHSLRAMESKQSKEKNSHFTEKMIVGSTQTLFICGGDTTRTTLVWLFMTMALHPDVQEKVYRELQSVLGEKPWAMWEDRMKLPYTLAVIMESQRWINLVPLNTPHWVSEDTKICGYDIPKGAVVISNTWSLHNDPTYWNEPEKFLPERFLRNGGNEVNLKAESFVPFSCGKRKCPAETIAMMEMLHYFTGVTQMFEVQVPKGRSVKMEGIIGLTYQPVPQELCFILRP